MRRTVNLLFILLLNAGVAAPRQIGKPEPAQSILNAAVKKAESSRKTVFLIFHASWCGWCKKLETALENPDVKKVIKGNYVIATLDVMESPGKKDSLENPGGVKIMADLGGEKSGLPFYAFLDSAGKKVADSNVMPKNQNIGYPGVADEIAAFEKLLKQTAPRMTDEERAEVIAYFKKNAVR